MTAQQLNSTPPSKRSFKRILFGSKRQAPPATLVRLDATLRNTPPSRPIPALPDLPIQTLQLPPSSSNRLSFRFLSRGTGGDSPSPTPASGLAPIVALAPLDPPRLVAPLSHPGRLSLGEIGGLVILESSSTLATTSDGASSTSSPSALRDDLRGDTSDGGSVEEGRARLEGGHVTVFTEEFGACLLGLKPSTEWHEWVETPVVVAAAPATTELDLALLPILPLTPSIPSPSDSSSSITSLKNVIAVAAPSPAPASPSLDSVVEITVSPPLVVGETPEDIHTLLQGDSSIHKPYTPADYSDLAAPSSPPAAAAATLPSSPTKLAVPRRAIVRIPSEDLSSSLQGDSSGYQPYVPADYSALAPPSPTTKRGRPLSAGPFSSGQAVKGSRKSFLLMRKTSKKVGLESPAIGSPASLVRSL
ncbi:hypothetical protein RQP46_006778 [Phenoliferia psychrophenolica]